MGNFLRSTRETDSCKLNFSRLLFPGEQVQLRQLWVRDPHHHRQPIRGRDPNSRGWSFQNEDSRRASKTETLGVAHGLILFDGQRYQLLSCGIEIVNDANCLWLRRWYCPTLRNGVGALVGEKTYGKGVVQTIHPLPDGSAVKITSARYLTPRGRDINLVGIEPDIVTVEPRNAKFGDPASDPQLQSAITYLQGRIAQLGSS